MENVVKENCNSVNRSKDKRLEPEETISVYIKLSKENNLIR